MSRSVAFVVALLALLVARAHSAANQEPAAEREDGAVAAYRAGDTTTARELWRAALAGTGGRERARIAYNLGNTAYRAGAPFDAVGWYTLSLREFPRDADAWANLEYVRAEIELEPADRGDLASTARRLVSILTRAEAQWLFLIVLALWAVTLVGEALRGRPWRGAVAAGAACLALASLPLLWHATRPEHPLLVVEKGGAAGRSEPRPDAKTLARLAAGAQVQWRDAVPGWVGVEDGEGQRLWLRETSVFDLVDGR